MLKKLIVGLGGGLLAVLLMGHIFLAEEPLDIQDPVEEKAQVISELVNSDLEENVNALSLRSVDSPNIDDVIVDSSDIIFDWCKMQNIIDGSGALDTSTGNGYDSSLSNRVIRTHDSITYQINLGLQLNGELNETVYRSGELNVRFVLPVTSDKAVFDPKSLAFFKNINIQETGGQQILTGQFVLPTNEQGFAIPCAARCDVVVAVKDMENNSRLAPTFSFSSKSNVWEHTVTPDPVTVTCRTYYKISSSGRTQNSLGTRKDYRGTNHNNTWLGVFNISISPKSSKGDSGEIIKEKGVFFPKKVQFTIDLSAKNQDSGAPNSLWLADWSFTGTLGVNGSSLTCPGLGVWDPAKNISNGQVAVSGNRVTVTLSGYGETGGTFRLGILSTCPNVGAFYEVAIKCSNLQAVNASSWESVVNAETHSNKTIMRNYPTGGYTQFYSVSSRCGTSNNHSMFLLDDGDGGAGNKAHHLNSDLREGQDAVLSRNQKLTLSAASVLNQAYTDYNHMNSINVYLLFDANCFEVDESTEKAHPSHSSHANWSGNKKILYIAKSNGTAFSSKAEMDSFNENTANNYRYYTSLTALNSTGAKCVGVCMEVRNYWSNNNVYRSDTWVQIDVPVKVRNSCAINKAYSITGGSVYDVNTVLGSHTSGSVALSSCLWKNFLGYMNSPSTFNLDGSIISQGTNVRYGTTVYVKGAKATTSIKIANMENGTTKDVFNFSEGEKFVWLKITPGFIGTMTSEDWNYWISIPVGLKLPRRNLTGIINTSCLFYGGNFVASDDLPWGGMITGGADQSYTLTTLSNGLKQIHISKHFSNASEFKPFWLCLEIDGAKVENGKNYTVDTSVSGDGALKISKLHQNYDYTGINVILNTSVALAKAGISEMTVDDNLRYTLTVQNTGTTIKDFEIRDLLPSAFEQTKSDTTYILENITIWLQGGSNSPGSSIGGIEGNGYSIKVKQVTNTSDDILTWDYAHNCMGKRITQLGIKGDLDSGDTIYISIELGVPEAIMGDIFYNRFQFKSSSLGSENVYSNWVKTKIPIVNADLTIKKSIQRNTWANPKGKQVFHYKVSTIDDRTPLTFYKTISIPEGSYSGQTTFSVPGRVYKVEELSANDWSIKSKSAGVNSYLLNPVSNWKDVGKTPSVSWSGTQELYSVLNRGGSAEVTFTNQGSFKDYTENNYLLNKLK